MSEGDGHDRGTCDGLGAGELKGWLRMGEGLGNQSPADGMAGTGGGLSVALMAVDRFDLERDVVVAWNGDTGGYEASVTLPAGGPGAADPVCRWTLASDRYRERDPSERFQACRGGDFLTVDSLINALRFEAVTFGADAMERLSVLADTVDRTHGPALIVGCRRPVRAGERLLIRVQPPGQRPWRVLHAGLHLSPGAWWQPADGAISAARRVLEVCWTRRWTSEERDLALAFWLEVLGEAGSRFCFSASDIADWCLSGRPVQGHGNGLDLDVPGHGGRVHPDQLRLPLP